MPCIYILESIKDGRYYVGSTANLKKRLIHHGGGFAPTTKRFGEIMLVFAQEYNSLKEARYIERRLKKLKREDYLKKIVEEGFIKIRIPNHHTIPR